jgi:hypothetical protein
VAEIAALPGAFVAAAVVVAAVVCTVPVRSSALGLSFQTELPSDWLSDSSLSLTCVVQNSSHVIVIVGINVAVIGWWRSHEALW